MNIEDALEWAENCNPPDRTIDDHLTFSQVIKTLAAEVKRLREELTEYEHMERLYHQKEMCQCSDDEACAHVRRAEAAEDKLAASLLVIDALTEWKHGALPKTLARRKLIKALKDYRKKGY